MPFRRSNARLSLACLLGLAWAMHCSLRAQNTPPAEPAVLTAARAVLFRQALAESQLVTEQFITALAARETALAAAGDYEEASRFQQRREQLAAIYAGTTSSLAESRAITLPLNAARVAGSVQSSADTLTHWRSAGSGAEWNQFRLPPGRYMLELEASMLEAPVAFASAKIQPQEKALFEFGEVTQLLSNGDNHKTFEITESEDDTTFTRVSVGPLTFTRTPLTLRLSATAGYPANVLRLRNLRLVPLPESAPPPAVATASPGMNVDALLADARETLAEELRAAQQAVQRAYVEQLEALASSKSAPARLIDAEKRRLDRHYRQGDHIIAFSPPTLDANASAGLDEFETLDDARLADGDPAAGDRFDIVHEGRTLSVRLLWLACPPTDGDAKAATPLARHFGIEVEDAIDIGRAARAFTSGYLRGKPLRLLARPVRDERGAILEALVFLPDVGLYQNVLIEQGLAAVQPPAAQPKAMPLVQTLLDSMTAREQQARKRKPPAGAWALTSETNGKR